MNGTSVDRATCPTSRGDIKRRHQEATGQRPSRTERPARSPHAPHRWPPQRGACRGPGLIVARRPGQHNRHQAANDNAPSNEFSVKGVEVAGSPPWGARAGGPALPASIGRGSQRRYREPRRC